MSARPSREQQVDTRMGRREQRVLGREQRVLERQQAVQTRQQAVQERQRARLSRESTDRQGRIDRLQRRVEELQARKPEGARAQRAQQRLLQTQNRQLQREQRVQQRDQARLQALGPRPQTDRSAAVQAAARGRFAAHFRDRDAMRAQAALRDRHHHWAPREAWRHRKRAVFVAWLGPVFWPYAYSDIFEYTFWPYAYEPGYWAYAYDDFVDTVFWGPDNRYSAYAGYPAGGGMAARDRATPGTQAYRQVCGDPQGGVTAWPIEEIAKAVRPTAEQRALLNELKAAAASAAETFRQSCSETYALTPPGRLRAMTSRIRATLDAVKVVRPALERFYASLNDEQQARFNALRPRIDESRPQQEANASPEESCGDPKSSLTQLPIERIAAVVRPAGRQKEALERLGGATNVAVKILQAACPDAVPQTPVGRLEAMEKRLEAMLAAADRVQPALDQFYATLSAEQKARFNTMPRVAEQ
ncbi:Spy/CpxP family protein refolding chaperone [Bradyrhizobium sp.]|uniref:Spy/CpxP family protein refolding chaperone n=1 Tax=Bradyrhizobium sp. TaxID=376 RepID=UPI004037F7EA